MPDSTSVAAIAVGAMVMGEGLRAWWTAHRRPGALARTYLGSVLVLMGLSVMLSAPAVAGGVDHALGVAGVTVLLRETTLLCSTVGAAGLMRLVGATGVRLRYVVAAALAGAAAVVWIVVASFGTGHIPVPARTVFLSVSGLSVVGILTLYVVRMTKVARHGDSAIRIAIYLTVAGFAASIGAEACMLASTLLPWTARTYDGGVPVIVEGGAALFVAAGSSYGEVAHWTLWLRQRRRCRANRAVIHQLWLYLEPLRQLLSQRPPASADTQREVVDVYDAVVLARASTADALSCRAALVAHARGLTSGDADRFIRAAELRSAVEWPDSVVARRSRTSTDVDLEPDTDPPGFDVCEHWRGMAALGRLVLHDRSVKRIVADECPSVVGRRRGHGARPPKQSSVASSIRRPTDSPDGGVDSENEP